MHRQKEMERIASCTYDELQDWKKHVLFCLEWFRKDNNHHEVDECEFLLKHIEEQIARLEENERT